MRTFNFSLLAVLSCITMIGATPVEIENRASDAVYVPWQQLMEVLTRFNILSPAPASFLAFLILPAARLLASNQVRVKTGTTFVLWPSIVAKGMSLGSSSCGFEC
jgi:hypothetical protein